MSHVVFGPGWSENCPCAFGVERTKGFRMYCLCVCVVFFVLGVEGGGGVEFRVWGSGFNVSRA